MVSDYQLPVVACLFLFLAMTFYWISLIIPKNMFFFQLGKIFILFSNLLLALTLLLRWIGENYFPLSNLYESLIFLSWGISTIHLFIEFQTKSRLIGCIVSPILFFLTGFSSLTLPTDMQKALPLVPSLQSNWLMMHVTMMMISYATLIVGSLLSLLYLAFLAFDRKMDSEGVKTSAEMDLTQNAFSEEKPNLGDISHVMEYVGKNSFDTIENSNLRPKYLKESNPTIETTNKVTQNSFLSETFLSQENLLKEKHVSIEGFNHTSIGSSSKNTEKSAMQTTVTGDISMKPENELQNASPSKSSSQSSSKLALLQTIDLWSYRIIGLGFPFLTIGIISGAVWANEAWGSYWSWDPKETWALITWLVFAIYLHARLIKGWQGKQAATLGSCGFFVIWICYLGVNFLGKGLHSYGWVF
jgi:cytochrome c-type biogenesis protein CcsB